MTMTNNQFKELHITQFDRLNRLKVKNFLVSQGLEFDEGVQYTIAIFDDDNLIATGSMDENVLKCIAVAERYTGLALTNKIVSGLINEQYSRGFEHIFVYTKPDNERIFADLGFYKIMEVPKQVLLLENKANGVANFADRLSKDKVAGAKIAGLVMNCNPFTNGHQHLIEVASKANDAVHVFVVATDRSQFSFADRIKLVQLGTQAFDNVYIHEGGKYLISVATFPSYFLKDDKKVVTAHAELDVHIFAKYIAPALQINARYVGEENSCALTAKYNEIMAKILPTYNINTIEIPRLAKGAISISASHVRRLLKEEKFDQIKEIVPKTTYDYLVAQSSGRWDR